MIRKSGELQVCVMLHRMNVVISCAVLVAELFSFGSPGSYILVLAVQNAKLYVQCVLFDFISVVLFEPPDLWNCWFLACMFNFRLWHVCRSLMFYLALL